MIAGKKDPRRQVMGKINRARGQQFENSIAAALNYYESIGFAEMEKTPEPMKIIRPMGNGQFLAIFEKRAQPDFKGTIKGGLSVVFEAKFTSGERMEQNRVLPQQAKRLDMHELLGARCFVVVGFATGGVYRIPWRVWCDMKSYFGRRYVTEADLKQYRVPTSKVGFPKILE